MLNTTSKKPEILSSKKLYYIIYQSIIDAIQVEGTCQEITKILLLYYCNCDTATVIMNSNLPVTLDQRLKINAAIVKIRCHVPIQYITEEAYFFDWKLKVTPAVLIPRSETAEMVAYIAQQNSGKRLSILDIGTGSGCIAIALKKLLKGAHVDALDLDAQALQLARYNAKTLKTAINFLQGDIFYTTFAEKKWDIIVSNPPYVRCSEQKKMRPNVVDYEPHHALFVDDNDPLIFYKRIAVIANKNLAAGGKLYLEINEEFGNEVKLLLVQNKLIDVCIIKDFQKKNRWVVATF